MRPGGWGALAASAAAALVVAVVAVAGAEHTTAALVETAVAETRRTQTMAALVDSRFVVAGGGLLAGAGLGAALAGGVVYWRKRRDFRRRLE